MTDNERNILVEKKQQIEEIMGAIRQSEGDVLNELLPSAVRKYGFKTFYIDEVLIVLMCQLDEKTSMSINLRHGYDEAGKYYISISKPMYYSDFDISKESEATIYWLSVARLIKDKKFKAAALSRLETFHNRVLELKKDYQEIEQQLEPEMVTYTYNTREIANKMQ